jgi:hypothetical protein
MGSMNTGIGSLSKWLGNESMLNSMRFGLSAGFSRWTGAGGGFHGLATFRGADDLNVPCDRALNTSSSVEAGAATTCIAGSAVATQ